MNKTVELENEQTPDTEHKIVMDVQDITKSLPLGRERVEILKGISFQIRGGEFIATHDPVVASHADRAIRIVDGLAQIRPANDASASPLQDTSATLLSQLDSVSADVQGVRFAQAGRKENVAEIDQSQGVITQ
jgi:hypothetical protein